MGTIKNKLLHKDVFLYSYKPKLDVIEESIPIITIYKGSMYENLQSKRMGLFIHNSGKKDIRHTNCSPIIATPFRQHKGSLHTTVWLDSFNPEEAALLLDVPDDVTFFDTTNGGEIVINGEVGFYYEVERPVIQIIDWRDPKNKPRNSKAQPKKKPDIIIPASLVSLQRGLISGTVTISDDGQALFTCEITNARRHRLIHRKECSVDPCTRLQMSYGEAEYFWIPNDADKNLLKLAMFELLRMAEEQFAERMEALEKSKHRVYKTYSDSCKFIDELPSFFEKEKHI